MSAAYEGQDPMVIAKQAERDLAAQKDVKTLSDSAQESGVNENVEAKFPGASVTVGSTGASDNRQIPVSEGGDVDPVTGKQTKASDFQGVGGPEDKAAIDREVRGGDNDIRDNIRQGGSTVRPAGSLSNDAAGGAGKSTQ